MDYGYDNGIMLSPDEKVQLFERLARIETTQQFIKEKVSSQKCHEHQQQLSGVRIELEQKIGKVETKMEKNKFHILVTVITMLGTVVALAKAFGGTIF